MRKLTYKIKEESNTIKMYREFNVDYSDFLEDLSTLKIDNNKFDTKSLLNKVKMFLEKKRYSVELEELKKLNMDQLISQFY